jgi:hypothetical protein
MQLEEIQKLWEVDSKIDKFTIHDECLKSDSLHHKYYNILNTEVIQLRKLEAQYKILYKDVWMFYNKMKSSDEYKNIEDDGFFSKNVLKTDKGIFIDSDKRLIEANFTIDIQKHKIQYLDNIIKEIAKRSYNIKNYIEYMKFVNGEL